MGVGVRSSQATKAASNAMPAPSPTSTSVASQAPSPALMTPQTSTPRPRVESTAPAGSSFALPGSRDSGTNSGVAASAASTMGTFTRKTEVQSKCSRSQPPITGPMPTPSPATAAQMPIAFGRSFAGKTFVRIERVVGMISAPPMPIAARVSDQHVRRSGERRGEGGGSEHH